MLFRGTATALVTPFQKDGNIDVPALARLVELQISEGIEALVPCGSTGESATLTMAERLEVIERTVEFAQRRVPVIAGTGTNDTRTTIELTNRAVEIGADAVLVVTPYYNKPSQKGLIEHYRALIRETDARIILYNVPGRTGVNMTAETQLEVAVLSERIIGTKEASGNLEQIQAIIRDAPPHFAVYSGDDSLTLPIIACGGQGVISVISNYLPRRFGEGVRLALRGDYSAARNVLLDLLPLMQANFLEPNPLPVKYILAQMGFIEEVYRLPLVPMSGVSKEKISRLLTQFGVTSAPGTIALQNSPKTPRE
ncbi:MAG: 4-hydroxy-tetrahydrodipicolinate synthase [Bacteroidota bacterium]|nr:4-hydroxy-tetrahydrodipicolinate synthase [Candidatus Kapabacteria bacterium]MDW8271153.1 4-hydroxy-tetrahydrodipicolinate synthase [Bacteroidota bacterium]